MSRINSETCLLLKMPKKLDLLLILPLTAYTAFELTIMWNEFNRVNIIHIKNAILLLFIIQNFLQHVHSILKMLDTQRLFMEQLQHFCLHCLATLINLNYNLH